MLNVNANNLTCPPSFYNITSNIISYNQWYYYCDFAAAGANHCVAVKHCSKESTTQREQCSWCQNLGQRAPPSSLPADVVHYFVHVHQAASAQIITGLRVQGESQVCVQSCRVGWRNTKGSLKVTSGNISKLLYFQIQYSCLHLFFHLNLVAETFFLNVQLRTKV